MLDLRVDYSSKHLAVCANNDNYMFSNISASSKETANLRSLNLFELINLRFVIIKILCAERLVQCLIKIVNQPASILNAGNR